MCLKPHWKRRCLRSVAPAAAMTKPAKPARAAAPATPEPADAWDSECSDGAADPDSDSDAEDREYFAGRYRDGGGVWFARLALDARGRPDVEQHPQLCDCDVLVLETLGSVGAARRGRGSGREFVVDPRATGVTRVMREQLVRVDLLAAAPDRLTLAFDSREFGGLDDYDAIDKMSDPLKLDINRRFAFACNMFADRERAHRQGLNTVVLDAPTMVSTRTLLHLVPKARVVAVSNSPTRAAFWVDATSHEAAKRVRLVRSDIGPLLRHYVQKFGCSSGIDAIFLDHCGCITSELGSLAAAVKVLRLGGGVLAATYCVRGVGRSRTRELFFGALRDHNFGTFQVFDEREYGKNMVFYLIYRPGTLLL